MFTVSFIYHNGVGVEHIYIANKDTLIYICGLLETDKFVHVYKVTGVDCKYIPRSFALTPFDFPKWKENLA